MGAFGIAPNKKVILFCGIGSEYAPHEADVARILSRAIENGAIDRNSAIIFRPHPGLSVDAQAFGDLPNVFFDHTVVTFAEAGDMSWEKESGAIARLVNSLHHADVVVSIASTITIDAVAFGKSVVCVGFDGYHREPDAVSLRTAYRNHTHLKDLSKTNGFRIAYSAEELADYITGYLENTGLDENGRKKIFEEFIGYLDGKSSERLSAVIAEKL